MGLEHVDQIVDDASRELSNNRRLRNQLTYSSYNLRLLVTARLSVKKTQS